MRKLSTILFTILFLGISFSYSFASCEDFTTSNASFGQTIVSYVNDDNVSQDVTASNTSYVTLIKPKRIGTIQKRFTASMSGDFVYFSGTFFIDTPDMSMLPAPYLYPVNSSSSQVLCNYRSVTTGTESIPTYHIYDGNDGSYVGSNKLSIFTFSLECPVSNSWDDSNNSYVLLWQTSYGALNSYEPYGTDIESFTSLSLSTSFRSTLVFSSNVCSDEQISNILDDINDSVVDVGDKLENIGDFIADDSVSTSVLGATSFFNQQDGSYYGLADFVSAVINFMKAIYNDYSCTPLELPAILGTTITLPCFSEWLHDFNETIYNLWKMVLYFYVGFVICSDLIKFIHDLRDPQNDNLTVMDI